MKESRQIYQEKDLTPFFALRNLYPPVYSAGSHSLRDKDPKFVNPGSPCIDKGVQIAGVNDNYHGPASDMGALET